MAKKSKKRQLDADSNESEKIDTNTHVKNDAPKKKKFKKSLEKSEKQNESNAAAKQNDKEVSQKNEVQNTIKKLDGNAPTNAVEGQKLKKKKKAKKQKNLDDKASPSDPKVEETTKSKRKELFKKKREEFKEKRKLEGSREGPSRVLDRYSLEEMKKMVAEIESRETISKTGARKLRILKKKVQVLEAEGGEKSLSSPDGTSQKTLKENKKTKLQNKMNKKNENTTVDANKSINKKKEKKEKQIAKKLKKNLFIEDRVGQKVDDSADSDNEEENGLNIQNTNDSDDSEDLDDSENDNKEDTTELDENINESSSEEGDDDSNEVEESSEKAKKGKNITDASVKNAQKKSNEDSNKKKPQQTGNDPAKKRRYVLFVGNIAYTATTVDLKQHFLTKVEKVKDIRIPLKPGTNTPRGFAYVEVENSEDYEKALSLHNTFINGRKINVEYTASGSKKGNRNPEVVHKNKKLHALRKEGKLAGSEKFSHKRSFRRNFNDNPKRESADGGKFPHKRNFKPNFKNNFKKKFDKKSGSQD